MNNIFSIYTGDESILTIEDNEKLSFNGELTIKGGQIINSYKEIDNFGNVILDCSKYTVFHINNLGSRTIYLNNPIEGETYTIRIHSYESINFDTNIMFFNSPGNVIELLYIDDKWIGL